MLFRSVSQSRYESEIDALISGNNLVKNALYEITGVHPTLYDDGTTSGTTVYLRAISGSELEVQGMGKFYNPKYNQSVDGFGIWDNKMYGTFSNIVGVFNYQNKEAVTANNAATGVLLAEGMIQWVSGDWSAATSITGDVSSATADVAGFVSPSYGVGDKVIWGGYSWTNVNGNIGASVDVLNLNAEWTKNVYDTTNYNIAYDVIEYDYANDMIIRRFEKESNVDVKCSKAQYDWFFDSWGREWFTYHSIAVQQFGNIFNASTAKGQLNIDVNNGYNECINFSSAFQIYLTFGNSAYQYSLTFGSGAYQNSLTFGSSAYQSNLTFGSVGPNTARPVKAYQNNLTFGSGAGQEYLTFGRGAYQENLTFGNNSYQNNLTFGSNARQSNLTFGSDAYQNSLTFGSNAIQSNISFGSNARQSNLTFGSNAIQANITFGSGASQFYITFGSGAYQQNLSFGSNAAQQNLTFAEYSQLNLNNQTINSNIAYVSFRTKSVLVPDLSSATYLFDGNIKEVYQRPDNALKIRYYDNSDVLQIVDIDD